MSSPPAYPPAYPHDHIEAISEDLFIVRGSIRLNPLIRISRNMTIIRHQQELSLVNPIRLCEAGMRDLQALGAIKRIIRLGSLHGLDDAWYARNFRLEFWGSSGPQKYPQPNTKAVALREQPLPFPDAQLFSFNAEQPESAILHTRNRGTLLTCDSIQHYGDYRHISPLARLLMPLVGFPKTTLIGPVWLKAATPKGGTLLHDFERLLHLEFDGLFSAHGSYLKTGAHAAVAAAMERTF